MGETGPPFAFSEDGHYLVGWMIPEEVCAFCLFP